MLYFEAEYYFLICMQGLRLFYENLLKTTVKVFKKNFATFYLPDDVITESTY